ncbi:uncharacterized protein CXorf58 homolog [Paramisgurnus dabryanus]|uniref:uncharacterized protein CXorf58 homolog n=1 Tax=Paramisgurnus dabryanus TaxID=90735 RepID=UPI003CCFC337
MEVYEDYARRIQSYWRSYRNRKLFKLLVNTIRSAEQCLTAGALRQLSPREADLLKDPSLKCRLRFRFAGPQFPPSVVFKIFQTGAGGQYLSGKKLFTSSNQFSSHLDELPACLGGRENGWRFLSLKVLSRNIRDDVKSGMKRPCVGNLKKGRSWGHSRFSGQQLSQRGLSSRCSARAKITAARMRRLYVLGDAERVSEEERNMDNINSYKTDNQKSTAEKYEIRIILPSVQTEDYGDSSSDSEWEEEAEELCNWSKQLNTDDVDAPEFV